MPIFVHAPRAHVGSGTFCGCGFFSSRQSIIIKKCSRAFVSVAVLGFHLQKGKAVRQSDRLVVFATFTKLQERLKSDSMTVPCRRWSVQCRSKRGESKREKCPEETQREV